MLKFDEEKHIYTLNGKQLISTTQLMRKHGLAPNYDGVSQEVLNAKARRGTLVHKEIENYIKSGLMGFTEEMYQFKDYADKNLNLAEIQSETMVSNDIVAGTIDLLMPKNNVIADIKTTSTIHKESVSWQLSIYLYLYVYSVKDCFDWKSWKGYVYHFDNKNGNLNVVEIPLKHIEDVERLIECERNGEIFKYEIDVKEETLSQIATLDEVIKSLDEQVKEAKAKQDKLKDLLMQEMKNRNLTTFENDNLKITLVSPSKAVSVTDFEALNKDIVEKYNKAKEEYDKEVSEHTTTTKKPSKEYLKITLKEKKDE